MLTRPRLDLNPAALSALILSNAAALALVPLGRVTCFPGHRVAGKLAYRPWRPSSSRRPCMEGKVRLVPAPSSLSAGGHPAALPPILTGPVSQDGFTFTNGCPKRQGKKTPRHVISRSKFSAPRQIGQDVCTHADAQTRRGRGGWGGNPGKVRADGAGTSDTGLAAAVGLTS